MSKLSIEDLEQALVVFQAGDQGVCVPVSREFLVSTIERLLKLDAWKQEALAVESGWDAQAVGKALNIPLGASIRKGILPAIEELKQRIAQLQEELQERSDLDKKGAGRTTESAFLFDIDYTPE